MATTYNHCQIAIVDASGNVSVIYPITQAQDVSVVRTSNANLPTTVTTAQKLANALGALAFKNVADIISTDGATTSTTKTWSSSVINTKLTELSSKLEYKKEWCVGLDKFGKQIYQCESYRGLGSDASGFVESSEYRIIYIAHEIANVDRIISCEVVFEKNNVSYRLPYIVNGIAHTYVFWVNQSNICFYNKGAFPDYYFHALITYTKTT